MNSMKVRIEFTEPLLATGSGNPDLHSQFIASKSKDAEKMIEEMADMPKEELVEKSSTVFPRHEGRVFIWDYQVKGFLKEAIGVLTELGQVKNLTKWTYKRVVDSALFVTPRRIFLNRSDGLGLITQPDGVLERPLRASTMQGDRIALARSECVNAGATAEFSITWLESTNAKSNFRALSQEVIEMALNYGILKGLGQWRNASYGRFSWSEEVFEV